MIQGFVIDSSIAIKWLRNSVEADADKALGYYKRFRNGEIEIIIPDLIFYELSNFGSRQPNETLIDCQELIENLLDPEMGIQIIPPDRELIQRTTILAHDLKISGYDASYLAIAEKFNTKLITADKKLLTAAPNLTTSL